jgi:hypothetical protein
MMMLSDLVCDIVAFAPNPNFNPNLFPITSFAILIMAMALETLAINAASTFREHGVKLAWGIFVAPNLVRFLQKRG